LSQVKKTKNPDKHNNKRACIALKPATNRIQGRKDSYDSNIAENKSNL